MLHGLPEPPRRRPQEGQGTIRRALPSPGDLLPDIGARLDGPVSQHLGKSALNPATNFQERLRGLDLTGEATIVTHQWHRWRHVPGPFAFSRGEEPERYRTLSYDEIAAKGSGWKLHLNFDAENPRTVGGVTEFLETLASNAIVTAYKIGKGGGKAHDQPGKESTVYVGHRDKAEIVAAIIEEGLAGSLDAPEGDALTDDTEFTSRVRGRFELLVVDPEFHQYGAEGIPYLNDDVGSIVYGRLNPTQVARQRQEAYNNADEVLKARYGAFYTGINPT